MKVNKGIFRAYDIRGIYPDELSEGSASAIGHAFAALLRKEQEGKLKIAVGRDTRLSSPKLFEAFTNSLLKEGCDVVDVGIVSTPQLYYSVYTGGFSGGAMITASHNPNPYNGIKLTRERGIPLGGESGLYAMRDFIERTESFPGVREQGEMSSRDIQQEYVDWSFKMAKAQPGTFTSLEVALDAGNGVGGMMTKALLEQAGVRVHPLYLDPDGRFPNHVPDPSKEENLKDIQKLVAEQRLPLGIALDGDADRMVFVDETGKTVRGDSTTAFLASLFANRGDTVLYDIRSSNAVPESMKAAGIIPLPTHIGHTLIKAHMRETHAMFAGEYSGHYYFGKPLFFETPLVFLLLVLNEMKDRGLPFSELVSPFVKYAYSGEINFETKDKEGKIKMIEEKYKGGRKTTIDGLRVDFDNWWFIVRPSNTEHFLRLIVEAETKELLEAKRQELVSILES